MLSLILALLISGGAFFSGSTSLPNQWIGISGPASTISSGDCDLGASTGSIWAAVGGTYFLDIIQIGIHPGGDWFAAWGRGLPYGDNSYYKEVFFGKATPGPHKYTVWLKNHTWWLYIDGHVKILVPDTFRNWKIRSRHLMTETSGTPDQHFGPGTWCKARIGSGWHFGAAGEPDTIEYPVTILHNKGKTIGFRLGE